MINRLTALAIHCILVIFVAGCASTPSSRLYTLSAAGSPAAPSSNLTVVVGPVSVPAVVDRPQIVVNVGPNEVRLKEFDRWAAPLQNNIARVVADNLVLMLGTPQVSVSAQALTAAADYRVAVDVQSFQSVLGEAAIVDALWAVRRTKDSKAEMGRTTTREAVTEKGYDALAAGHSRALARLSQDIADAVRALERSGK